MVGEGAGLSETATLEPFTGPSGNLLDRMIRDSLPGIKVCLTNTVACIPYVDASLSELEQPGKKEVEACRSRLSEFIDICFRQKPILVALGKAAERALKPFATKASIYHCVHPAAILRQEEQGEYDYENTLQTFKKIYQILS